MSDKELADLYSDACLRLHSAASQLYEDLYDEEDNVKTDVNERWVPVCPGLGLVNGVNVRLSVAARRVIDDVSSQLSREAGDGVP